MYASSPQVSQWQDLCLQNPYLRIAGELGEELAERLDDNVHQAGEEPGLGAELLRGESDPSPEDASQNVSLADVVWGFIPVIQFKIMLDLWDMEIYLACRRRRV